MFHARTHSKLACFLCAISFWNFATLDEDRPYEFSFNITDFQHRYEKKDAEGLITGEYGFITADGVYHETGYATDKNGDFIITRMTYRRIKSWKDAQVIFKDRPEAAKKLVEAVARACGSCKIVGKSDEPVHPTRNNSTPRMEPGPVIQRMLNIGAKNEKGNSSPERNQIPREPKNLSNERTGKSLAPGSIRNMVTSTKSPEDKTEPVHPSSKKNATTGYRALDNATDDLYYRFNYTITTHGHRETGYKSGRKDGDYRARNENGTDIRVKYLSNEFGHQPNVSIVPSDDAANETQRLKGYSFLWNWS